MNKRTESQRTLCNDSNEQAFQPMIRHLLEIETHNFFDVIADFDRNLNFELQKFDWCVIRPLTIFDLVIEAEANR
jgi:hypothetical protein